MKLGWSLPNSLHVPSCAFMVRFEDLALGCASCCLRKPQVSDVWTADRDFSRFVAIKTMNPLIT